MAKVKGLDEDFFFDCFLSGLSEEIKLTIHKFAPKTLNHAYSLAKLRKGTLENENEGKVLVKRSYTISNWGSNVNKSVISSFTKGLLENPHLKNVNLAIKRLSPAEMHSRKEHGLCYNCD